MGAWFSIFYTIKFLCDRRSRWENDLLPANPQGVWNNSTNPPWQADYHVDINLQMNYWPTRQTNLHETTKPYDRYISALMTPGRKTAKDRYGAHGRVVHNETDSYGFTGLHNWATSFWFPEAAAWTTPHPYDAYRSTGDADHLRQSAYPVIKRAAEFRLDFLHIDPRDGKLVVSPGFSSASSSGPPRWTTCGTRTRRSRSTAISAPHARTAPRHGHRAPRQDRPHQDQAVARRHRLPRPRRTGPRSRHAPRWRHPELGRPCR
jgi:hypothetical protein